MIQINHRYEYDYCISQGYVPLQDWRKFKLNIHLRIAIQHELFGSGDFVQENQRFYKWCWDNKQQNCEETCQTLHNYNSWNISHIISKGSDRRMATDPRNVNILSKKMHDMWEFGTIKTKKKMNIWQMNNHIIQLLHDDYATK